MRFKVLLSTVTACLAATIAVPASAATLLFELSGPNTASFQLEEGNAENFSNTLFGPQLQFNGVTGTFNGTSETASSIRLFARTGAALIINGTSLGTQALLGPSLFSGTGTNFTFNRGTFNLRSNLISQPANQNFTVTISEVGAAVPEPGTWAMMLLGFGFVGGAMRSAKRRQKVTVSYA